MVPRHLGRHLRRRAQPGRPSSTILHAEIGKTFFFGNLTVGGYYGAGGANALWSDVDGGRVTRGGFIGSYTHARTSSST